MMTLSWCQNSSNIISKIRNIIEVTEDDRGRTFDQDEENQT